MNTRPQSLLRAIATRMATIAVVWLALMTAFVQGELERNARVLRLQSLEQAARLLARDLRADEGGGLSLAAQPDLPPGYRFAVREPGGRLVASSDEASAAMAAHPLPVDLAAPEAAMARARDLRTVRMPMQDGRIVLAVELAARIAGTAGAIVVVAEDDAAPGFLLDDLVEQFFARIGWLLIPGVGLLVGVSLLSIRAELRPVEHVAAAAEAIGPHSTGVRLPDRFVPREVMPLIETVNGALERLERSLAAQREFTADAAHELKTPLAVMRAQIDAMPPGPQVDALRGDVEAMSRLIAQLLRLAEADQLAVPPDAACDLVEVVREVTGALGPLALARGRSLALDAPDAPVLVRGLPGPLAQAVRNLVENALKHAPEGSTVALSIDKACRFTVADEGPGIAEVDRPHIFKRFWRRDRNAGDGAGLGLAIAAKIVEAHGGTLAVEAPARGGARFAMALAPATGPDPREGTTP